MINVVQAALYSAINSISGLTVYGHVPESEASYPYVVLDPMQLDDNSTQGETECFDGSFTVHVWSQDKSSLETATIQKQIYDVLHLASLTATGYEISIIRQESTNIFIDPDGITRHGVQTYDIVFEVPTEYTY